MTNLCILIFILNIATDVTVERKDKTMLKRLSEFNIGETGQITKVEGEGRIRRRLFDMGITPGAEVYLRKKAPLGDPMEITIRGYELTLRKDEADLITLNWKGKVRR